MLLNGIAAEVLATGLKISVRDAYFYRALQRFREGKSNLFEREKGSSLKNTVQKMLLEEMVYGEMKTLQYTGGSRAIAKTAIDKQRKDATGKKDWSKLLARFSRTEKRAVDRLWKSMEVDGFIQKKVDTMRPIVTDADVKRYIEQRSTKKNKAANEKELEGLKGRIRRILRKERMRQELEEWIVYLKKKYRVVNYLDS